MVLEFLKTLALFFKKKNGCFLSVSGLRSFHPSTAILLLILPSPFCQQLFDQPRKGVSEAMFYNPKGHFHGLNGSRSRTGSFFGFDFFEAQFSTLFSTIYNKEWSWRVSLPGQATTFSCLKFRVWSSLVFAFCLPTTFFSFSFFSRPVELSEVDGASGKLFRYSSPKLGQILQSFIHIPSKYLLFIFMFILRLECFTFIPLACEKWAVSPRPYSVQALIAFVFLPSLLHISILFFLSLYRDLGFLVFCLVRRCCAGEQSFRKPSM